jgi:hypothetical protein
MGKVDIALSENFMGCAEVSIVREQSAGHRATGNTGAMFKILVSCAILGYFEKAGKRLTSLHGGRFAGWIVHIPRCRAK